jgi:hypothetical protein
VKHSAVRRDQRPEPDSAVVDLTAHEQEEAQADPSAAPTNRFSW